MSARYEATYRGRCERCQTERRTTLRGGRKSLPETAANTCPGCWDRLALPFTSAQRCVPLSAGYVHPEGRRPDYRGLAEYPPRFATLAALRADPGLALARVVR